MHKCFPAGHRSSLLNYFLQVLLCSFLLLFFVNSLRSQELLPPQRNWRGASELLIVKKNNPWITPAESTDFKETPSYSDTRKWLQRLTAASPLLAVSVIGKTAGGQDIIMVKVSKEPSFLKTGNSRKPLLLVQCGIHAGEIDGKDAGLMLLRDIAKGDKASLIDKVNLLFIPVLNVDGHERTSPFNRINQRGPDNMGWRTNAQNLNLNRDYVKLDTREIRAVIQVIHQYHPDLYFDIHVTDGADYQYDITYGFIGQHAYSPAISGWLAQHFKPAVDRDLESKGHIPGPLMFAVNDGNFSEGNSDITFPPDYSHAYGNLVHLPTILVENHSLKAYKQRVLGTYVLIEASLKLLATDYLSLRKAVQEDEAVRLVKIPLSWKNSATVKDSMLLKGILSKELVSSVTLKKYTQWLGDTVTMKVPFINSSEPDNFITMPRAWLIPPGYPELIERLRIHGIKMDTLMNTIQMDVELYRISHPSFASQPNEGHIKVKAICDTELHKELFPPGTVRIYSDQPLSALAAFILEPSSGSSFFQWGFFPGIFSRTEYIEPYIMEPLARTMLDKSPELAKEFELLKKSNPEIIKNQSAILEWFYKRTPFYDAKYLLYPVARLK